MIVGIFCGRIADAPKPTRHSLNILHEKPPRSSSHNNPIIEALNGWIKEELFLDFDLANASDVPTLLDDYVRYFNFQRPAAALGFKSPVQFRTERGV